MAEFERINRVVAIDDEDYKSGLHNFVSKPY